MSNHTNKISIMIILAVLLFVIAHSCDASALQFVRDIPVAPAPRVPAVVF